MNKVHFSTGKDDWETPIDLFEKLDNEFHYCRQEQTQKDSINIFGIKRKYDFGFF